MPDDLPEGDIAYLHNLWLEVLTKRAELARDGTFDLGAMGTSAGNYGNLRIVQQNMKTALHDDTVTWLMTARLKLANVAINPEEDGAAIRKGLVELAATVVGWIEEIDSM
jgi:hypothetical protein